MHFSTKIEIPLTEFKINHRHKIAMIGSCFTQNIGAKLQEDKFDVSINPFGILFNPISVAKAIKYCVNQTKLSEVDIIKEGEQWLSLAHHSSFNSLKKNTTLEKINQSITDSETYYVTGDYLIITLGTAWVYEHILTNSIVANCHKIPNKNFTKRLLTVAEIVEVYAELLVDLQKKNPTQKVIFTVSPVRHWKDGVVENNRSKAILHLTIMELESQFDSVSYFPSYELVLDELRDYRFYKEDMLHPNQQAVAYIYERFSATYYTEETIALNKRIRKLILAQSHRPFNLKSDGHQLFLKQTALKINEFKKEFPFIQFD